jgi:hypothetical protein
MSMQSTLRNVPEQPGLFVDNFGNEYVGVARFHELYDVLEWIVSSGHELNEWDAVEKWSEARKRAQDALGQ